MPVPSSVAEPDAGQLLALRRRDHVPFEAVAFEARADQRRRQHELAALGVHQRVVERRVDVERLVGGDRPRGGGPDHRERFADDLLDAECGGQPVGLGAQEADIHRLALLVGILDLELGQ